VGFGINSLASVLALVRRPNPLEVKVSPSALPEPKHARLGFDSQSPQRRWSVCLVPLVMVLKPMHRVYMHWTNTKYTERLCAHAGSMGLGYLLEPMFLVYRLRLLTQAHAS